MSPDSEHDDHDSAATGKGSARRRVDAYHEAMRERQTLRELEQPFLLELDAWGRR